MTFKIIASPAGVIRANGDVWRLRPSAVSNCRYQRLSGSAFIIHWGVKHSIRVRHLELMPRNATWIHSSAHTGQHRAGSNIRRQRHPWYKYTEWAQHVHLSARRRLVKSICIQWTFLTIKGRVHPGPVGCIYIQYSIGSDIKYALLDTRFTF